MSNKLNRTLFQLLKEVDSVKQINFLAAALTLAATPTLAEVDAGRTEAAVVEYFSTTQTRLQSIVGVRSTDDRATVYLKAVFKDQVWNGELTFFKMDDGTWYMMGGSLGDDIGGPRFKQNLDMPFDLD